VHGVLAVFKIEVKFALQRISPESRLQFRE
jgi:hypothetical protein